uniref:PHD finger protein ALFIN-LIKE n=1 Tax=Oryza brachyantha TaxID=4533 RepID=J3KWL9_ORYBR
MDPASGRNPRFEAVRSIDDIFKDFIGRRTGIVRAFTEDLEAFTAQCKPDLDGLCLYGYANGTWEVAPPAQHVPTELPEPTVGINIPRDTMYKRDWVALLTVFSDSWLLAVAFFHGARLNLDREGRVRLFDLINSVPTVYESVFGVKKSREQRHPFQRKKNSADGDDDGAIFLRKRDDEQSEAMPLLFVVQVGLNPDITKNHDPTLEAPAKCTTPGSRCMQLDVRQRDVPLIIDANVINFVLLYVNVIAISEVKIIDTIVFA